MEGTVKLVQGKTVQFTDGSLDGFRTPPLPPIKTPPIVTTDPFPKEAVPMTVEDSRSSPVAKMASGDKPSSAVGSTRKPIPELPSINKSGSGKPGSGRSRRSANGSRQADPSVVLTYLKKNTYDDLGKLLLRKITVR